LQNVLRSGNNQLAGPGFHDRRDIRRNQSL